MAALIIQGVLNRPDFIVIADTGREKPTTWDYLDSVVRPALKAVGLEVHRIGLEFAFPSERELFSPTGKVLIPAFTNSNGAGKLSNFCTNAWKVHVISNWFRKVHQIREFRRWIGFSLNEDARWSKMMKTDDYKAGLIRFPLVELRYRRQDAINAVHQMGWPTPPRSRCWMCPNQSDYEWAEVQRDHPKLFDDAMALDESIRERDPHAFLHSTIQPLRQADLTQQDDLFSGSTCPSGECFL